jgi:hypothetical protein
MSLTRTPHWATREYHQFILSELKTPFEWGQWDCCLFAASAIQSFTGVDIAAPYFRGHYNDQASAMALIHTVTGGSTVADAAAYCAAQHGLVQNTHPLLAQRGDLVVINNKGNTIAGVVHLNGKDVISVSQAGLVRLPIRSVVQSWRV